jgi:hypothetical protein
VVFEDIAVEGVGDGGSGRGEIEKSDGKQVSVCLRTMFIVD